MPKPDLIECRAKIQFANQEIQRLEYSIDEFIKAKPYGFFPYPETNSSQVKYVFEIRYPFPIEFKIAAGVILHLQRSSLDNLACALAARNGKDLKNVYFPITCTADALDEKSAKEKIRKLSESDREKIKALKPYKGGNNILYALHHLNIHDKHRSLAAVALNAPQLQSFEFEASKGGGGIIRKIWVTPMPFKAGDVVAIMDCDGRFDLNLQINISFSETYDLGSKSIIEILRDFSSMCNSILDRFDD